jgi:hypothetical protein
VKLMSSRPRILELTGPGSASLEGSDMRELRTLGYKEGIGKLDFRLAEVVRGSGLD